MRTQLSGAAGPQGAWQPRSPTRSTEHPFPDRLAALAEMIDRGLPLRVVAMDANGGYDTHENQAATLAENLGLLSSSLAAFQADLEARGIADRVLVHVWSEFGRRPAANGSGTDHGAGGASLMMGTRASGTTVGEFPGLATLDAHGNLRHTVDFRGVYRGLTEQWLGVDADGIVPGASRFTAPRAGAVRALAPRSRRAARAGRRAGGGRAGAPRAARRRRAPSARPSRARAPREAPRACRRRGCARVRGCAACGRSRTPPLLGVAGGFAAPAPFAARPRPAARRPRRAPAGAGVAEPASRRRCRRSTPTRAPSRCRRSSSACSSPSPRCSAGTCASSSTRSRAEDPHDLQPRPRGRHRARSTSSTSRARARSPRARSRSRAGRWTLFCSLPGHEAAGMKATLTVDS